MNWRLVKELLLLSLILLGVFGTLAIIGGLLYVVMPQTARGWGMLAVIVLALGAGLRIRKRS